MTGSQSYLLNGIESAIVSNLGLDLPDFVRSLHRTNQVGTEATTGSPGIPDGAPAERAGSLFSVLQWSP